jgi:hypothetical protein
VGLFDASSQCWSPLCPQVLYMDAMEYFPDELQEILDVMTEKELRVRLPLEELELLLED